MASKITAIFFKTNTKANSQGHDWDFGWHGHWKKTVRAFNKMNGSRDILTGAGTPGYGQTQQKKQ